MRNRKLHSNICFSWRGKHATLRKLQLRAQLMAVVHEEVNRAIAIGVYLLQIFFFLSLFCETDVVIRTGLCRE